jgi:hypothetical protein
MGSTVIVLAGRGDLRLVDGLGPCSKLRLGQALARRG